MGEQKGQPGGTRDLESDKLVSLECYCVLAWNINVWHNIITGNREREGESFGIACFFLSCAIRYVILC